MSLPSKGMPMGFPGSELSLLTPGLVAFLSIIIYIQINRHSRLALNAAHKEVN